MMQPLWQRLGLILAGALLLLWAPAVNGYPFIYTDTGTYLWSSVRFEVPQDRPIGYSLVVRAADLLPPIRYNRNVTPASSWRTWLRNSLATSLWTVVAFQALGTSYLLVTIAETVLERARRRELWILLVLGLTAATTAGSVYVGAVMPDIFTGWLYLGAVVFFLARNEVDRWLGALCSAIAVFVHNSHLPLALAMLCVGAFGVIAVSRWRVVYLERVKQLGIVLTATTASVLLINVVLGAGFVLARGTDTFLLNRFAEAGVLTKTPSANCGTPEWVLCNYQAPIAAHRGELSWYLYGAGNPSDEVGWNNGTAEQRAVVLHALQCCVGDIVTSGLIESWKQFWLVRVQGHYVYLDDHWNAVIALKNLYPHELSAFQSSIQQSKQSIVTHWLPFDEQQSQLVFLGLAFCLLGAAVFLRSPQLALLLASGLIFITLNALIAGGFGHAEARYQGRVFWLVPFLVWCVGAAWIQESVKRRRHHTR